MKFIDKQLVSPFEIAERLGIVTKNGNPHGQLIRSVLGELQISYVKRSSSKSFLYDEHCIQQVRWWFYQHVGIDFPDVLHVAGVRYIVRYLPEEEKVSTVIVA